VTSTAQQGPRPIELTPFDGAKSLSRHDVLRCLRHWNAGAAAHPAAHERCGV